jgi:serine/threonine protein kinase/WD40 repeat protein
MADPQRVRAIFLEAVENHAPDQWSTFLDQACGGDPDLRRRIDVLLRAHEQADSRLDVTTLRPEAVLNQPVAETPGTVLGPYKLVEQLGEGGMGVVWMAQQTEPVKRLVALKLIKRGMDSRQVLARFDAERQALALMDHLNIAKVLDAGTTPGGRPYFVMDLVKGVPITRYCDKHHLTPRQRLELFVPVCQAVQHAHQKGIIHRDLKPSNVLVALYDGKPVPKVIDFGVAKADGHLLTDKTLVTGFGNIVGTLEYMSPEQAEVNQLDIDTRSDIYALGVLLYELLAGSPPFTRKELEKAGLLEMLRVIREQEPPVPSTRLSTAEGLPTLAANRGTEPAKLTRLVKGELDWIVMKALEKDRSRRYATAYGFAMDVRRYLADEPVLACPPSVGYRIRKSIRRNKGAVLAAALVVVALVGGLLGTTWGMLRATDAEAAAVALAGEKERERDKAAGAERGAKHRLYEARLAQARASRSGQQPGRRNEGWLALTEAAQLAHELELGPDQVLVLRNEAIACLAVSDLQWLYEWPGNPPGTSEHPGFDADLKHYARSDCQGNISIRRVWDDQELAVLPNRGPAAASLSHAHTLGFSPDGALLAVHYARALPERPATTFLLWDWRRRTVVPQPAVMLHCPAVFSPDGRHLALAHRDGTVIVSEVAGSKVTNRLKALPEPMHLAFHPNNTQLAIASGEGTVQVWDVATGKLHYAVSAPHPWHVAWHPRGELLAAACHDESVHLWDGATGRSHLLLQGHQAAAVGVTFAANGDVLISTSWDGSIRLWNPWTGRELLRFMGDAFHVSRDGYHVASRAGDTHTLWEVKPSREFRTLPRTPIVERNDIAEVGFSPDGRWLAATADNGIRLWDVPSGKAHAFFATTTAEDVEFHPSGKELFTSGAAGVYRWAFRREGDTLQIGPARKLPVPGGKTRIGLDKRGRTLAAVDGSQRGLGWILDLESSGNDARQLHHPLSASVAVSPDGSLVAAGAHNGRGVGVWESSSGKLVRHLLPEEPVTRVAFSPNGRWLVIGVRSELSLWEVASWKRIGVIRREQGSQTSNAAFSGDGSVLAVTISLSAIQLHELATWKPFARLQGPHTDPVWVGAFSPDSSLLAVTTLDGDLAIWDLRLVRTRLQEIGLDWPQRPYPPAPPRAEGPPMRVEVDPGELGGKPKG